MRPKTFGRENRRRAGEAAHRKHGVRRARFEKLFAARYDCQKPRSEKRNAALQRDGGQRDNLHAMRGFHGLLIHVLRRNEQRDVAAALEQLLRHGQAGKEMPARPAAGDGDEGRLVARAGVISAGRMAVRQRRWLGRREGFTRLPRDAEQQPDAREHREQVRAAVADERQRQAFVRQRAGDDADVDEGLQADQKSDAAPSRKPNVSRACSAM